MKKFLVILIALLALSVLASSADRSPQKWIFGGNSFSGATHTSHIWLAEHADFFIAGVSDWADSAFHDSVISLRRQWGLEYGVGPYRSTQEFGLTDRSHPTWMFEQRMTDTALHAMFIYAAWYLDSIGLDDSLLVVHNSDSSISQYNQSDGHRYADRMDTISAAGEKKRRFTYQYWDNTSADTSCYPAGYTWLANSMNENVRNAIAYACGRYYYEDSLEAWGPSVGYWTAAFADNVYRAGAAPILNSYWSEFTYWDVFANPNMTSSGCQDSIFWCSEIKYSTRAAAEAACSPSPLDSATWTTTCDSVTGPEGGATANAMDWSELTDPKTNALTYYDNGTVLLNGRIKEYLDSLANAYGKDSVIYLCNVDKFSAPDFAVQIKKFHCLLENPVDPAKSWARYRNWLTIADTMANRDTPGVDYRYLAWMFMGDFTCAGGNPNCDRTYYAHHAFYLDIYNENILYGPFRFNDTTRARQIMYLEPGDPVNKYYLTDSTGTGDYGDKTYCIRRKYATAIGDTTLVIFRSGYSYDELDTDSIHIGLDGDYYTIDVNGDTAETTIDSIWMYPYMGYFGTDLMGGESAPTITAQGPDAVWVDSVITTTATYHDDYGVATFLRFLKNPSDDSIHLVNGTFDPVDTDSILTYDYTFTTAGTWKLIDRISDDSGHTVSETLLVTVTQYVPPGTSDSIAIPIKYTAALSTNGTFSGHQATDPMIHGCYYGNWLNLYLVDIDSLKTVYAAYSGNIDSAYYLLKSTATYVQYSDTSTYDRATVHKILVSWDSTYVTAADRDNGVAWNSTGMGSGTDYEATELENRYLITDSGWAVCEDTVLEWDDLPCQVKVSVTTDNIDSINNDLSPYGIVAIPTYIVGNQNNYRIYMAGAANADPPVLVLWVPAAEEVAPYLPYRRSKAIKKFGGWK